MEEYIKKTDVLAEIKRRYKFHKERNRMEDSAIQDVLYGILNFLNTLDVKESDETAEAFARIIRANLTGINEDVQYKFEQLYKEITGEKMYQGYND